MNTSAVKSRIAELLASPATDDGVHGLYQATVTVVKALYGPESSQENDLRKAYADRQFRYGDGSTKTDEQKSMILGVLSAMKAEVEAGFFGSLQAGITAEVLTDFIGLSRTALDASQDEGSKNVGAVLAAAAFEDTIRRMAAIYSIPHKDKLADLLMELKAAGHIQGAQVGIAQSYLNFRNNALHADWSKIERSAVHSVLAFTEQLILSHFS